MLKEERENQRMIEQDKMRKAASLASAGSVNKVPTLASERGDWMGQMMAEGPKRVMMYFGLYKPNQVCDLSLIVWMVQSP